MEKLVRRPVSAWGTIGEGAPPSLPRPLASPARAAGPRITRIHANLQPGAWNLQPGTQLPFLRRKAASQEMSGSAMTSLPSSPTVACSVRVTSPF